MDNICHEHVTYFAVKPLIVTLERAGLEVIDVQYSKVNGGCIRTLVAHKGKRAVQPSVAAALSAEGAMGLASPCTWVSWGLDVSEVLDETKEFLDKYYVAGKSVYLYGASTRGGTFLQMIGAGPELLPKAVERSPAKWNKVMATTNIPIISESAMRADPPDALLVSPWFFRDVFVKREKDYLSKGGVMVFPLPYFEKVTHA